MRAERRDLLLLMLAAVALIGTGLGLRDPWPADEPRFALIAREMVERGQWLFPRIGGDLYPDKPPLYFWVMATAYALTGSLRVGFLLPALLSALGVLSLVHDLSRRLWGREAALAATGTLLVTVQFIAVMRGAQIDPFLCLLTTFSLYALLRHLLLGPAWRWFFAGAVAAGLGVVTKGVGFLPLLVLLPFAWLRHRGAQLPVIRGEWRWPLLGIGGLLLGIAVWFVPMVCTVAASGAPDLVAYRDEILFQQTVTRYSEAWHHVRPWYYFLASVIPGLWLPWSLLLFWLVPRWREAWRELRADVWLPLGWVIVALLFFSMSTGKRGVYIFPALPALALAAAPYLPSLYRRRSVLIAARVLAALLACCIIAAWAALQFDLGSLRATAAENGVTSPWPIGVMALLCAGAVLLLHHRRPLLAWPAVLLGAVACWGLWLMPQFNGERSGREFTAAVMRTVGPTRPLGLVAYKEQFLLYLDRPIVNFGHSRWREGSAEYYDAARWLAETPQAWLLVPASAADECFRDARVRLSVGRSAGDEWLLVSAPASPACVARGEIRRFHYAPPLPPVSDLS